MAPPGRSCAPSMPASQVSTSCTSSRPGPMCSTSRSPGCRRFLADNPFLAKMMTDTDTAGLKRIGEAHLYLRGMQSTVGMKSVPADMIVFDELDEATPEAKAMARERLAHSRLQADHRAVEPDPAGLRHRRELPGVGPAPLDPEVSRLRSLDGSRQGVPDEAGRGGEDHPAPPRWHLLPSLSEVLGGAGSGGR